MILSWIIAQRTYLEQLHTSISEVCKSLLRSLLVVTTELELFHSRDIVCDPRLFCFRLGRYTFQVFFNFYFPCWVPESLLLSVYHLTRVLLDLTYSRDFHSRFLCSYLGRYTFQVFSSFIFLDWVPESLILSVYYPTRVCLI